MAAKGDKARLYDMAVRMYTADGKSLTEIEAALGVSRQTLSAWKGDTRKPGETLDEWDRAKAQKRENIRRLKDLFERELRHVEEQPQGSLTAASMDALSKLGSLVQRWEAVERAAALAGQDDPAAAETSRPIKTAAEAVIALQEAVEKKVNAMLTQPSLVSLAGIKEIQQSLELVEKLRARYTPNVEETGKPGGLSDDAAEAIRRQILGLSK